MSDGGSKQVLAELELLGGMVQGLADAADDPAQLLATVARQTASALQAFCGFLRVSGDGRWLDGVTYTPAPGDTLDPDLVQLLASRISLEGDAYLAIAIRERRVVQVEGVPEETLRALYADPVALESARRFASRASIFVPVLRAGRAVGALALLRRGEERRPFTARDVAFAEQLARHAALALTTAALVAAEREQAARLQLVSTLARDIAVASSDHEALLEVVVRRVGSATGDACVLRFATADGHGFAANGYVYHLDPAREAALRAALRDLPDGVHSGLARQILDTGQSVLVPVVDLAAVQRSATREGERMIEALAPASLLAVPVRSGGQLAAALTVSRGAGRPPFTERDRELVEELAVHVGIAIGNARLIAHTRRTAERWQALTVASGLLAASEGDPLRVQQLLADELGRALGGVCVVDGIDAAGAPCGVACVGGADPSFVARVRAVREAAVLSPTPIRRRILDGETVALSGTPDEVAAGVAPHWRAVMVQLGVRDLLSFPLRDGQRVFGAVSLLRTTPTRFSAEERMFAEELIEHAALALRNGTLLGELQRELSERERTERALRKTEEQLLHAQKMEAIGRLAGGIAHDFNNLLSVVLSSCEFIEGELPIGHPSRDDVDAIREAGDRAARMTRQLLAFSRQGPAEREVLDLGAQIEAMQPWLQRLLGERITVVTDGLGKRGLIEADPTQIEQVVLNLAINARDAMPAGGTVTFESEAVELDQAFADLHPSVRPGPHVMLVVTDVGEGMEKAVMERIFEPFFTTKPRGKGTGLGLSTVFGIVSQGDGAIVVDSAPGRGTTFRVYWPRVQHAISRRPLVRTQPPTGHERILIVEDDSAVRRVLVAILTRGGYRVMEATNGAEALGVFDGPDAPVDLVLTDVVMPVMGGPQLALALRARRPEQRIVFMSGYSDEQTGRDQLEALRCPMLAKPLRADSVLLKVREALEAPVLVANVA